MHARRHFRLSARPHASTRWHSGQTLVRPASSPTTILGRVSRLPCVSYYLRISVRTSQTVQTAQTAYSLTATVYLLVARPAFSGPSGDTDRLPSRRQLHPQKVHAPCH